MPVFLVIMLIVFLGACQKNEGLQSQAAQPQQIPAVEVTLLAVGDNLIHNTLYEQAETADGYDFSSMYEKVEPLIQEADIAFINQETPLATEVFPPANYPLFNTPTQVGDELLEIGFDVISHANNHMFDKGEKGMIATLDYWDTKKDTKIVGIYRNDADMADIRVISINGLRIAFLACTEMTNGMSIPDDSELRYILTSDEEMLQEQITQAKQLADLVVMAPHWGDEGSHQPNERQKALAQKMAQWGVDIIIGSHSHTLQPIEYIERQGEQPTLVIYSLGNFISGQHGAKNMVAGALRVTISKDYQKDPLVSISKVEFVPTITHFGSGISNLQIYPFSEYTEELAQNHGVRKYDSSFSYEYITNTLTEVIGSEFLVMN